MKAKVKRTKAKPQQRCRICGCTELDCSQCIAKTGHPCHWIEDDLCSACMPDPTAPLEQHIRDALTDIIHLCRLKNLLNPEDVFHDARESAQEERREAGFP